MNAVKTIAYAGFLAVGGIVSVLTIIDCIDEIDYAIYKDRVFRKMDQQEESHMDAVEWVESVKSQVLNK